MKAELKIAALTAEHNLPFLLSDHLVQLQKKSFLDSNVCQCVSCGRKKTAAIIKNVLGRQTVGRFGCHFEKKISFRYASTSRRTYLLPNY